jgi:uncharacterized membrane-anchored protein
MYLGTGDIIATIIALLGALTVLGYAIKENISLNSENSWLRKRNKELKKQLDSLAPLPWSVIKSDKEVAN